MLQCKLGSHLPKLRSPAGLSLPIGECLILASQEQRSSHSCAALVAQGCRLAPASAASASCRRAAEWFVLEHTGSPQHAYACTMRIAPRSSAAGIAALLLGPPPVWRCAGLNATQPCLAAPVSGSISSGQLAAAKSKFHTSGCWNRSIHECSTAPDELGQRQEQSSSTAVLLLGWALCWQASSCVPCIMLSDSLFIMIMFQLLFAGRSTSTVLAVEQTNLSA